MADVTVLGSGPAALGTALYLARSGVDVALVEQGTHGANPKVMVGFADGPHRLGQGLGAAVAGELMGFALRGRELLRELDVGRWAGGLHAAMGDREAGEVADGVAAHSAQGDPAELWSAQRVEALGRGFGPGRFVPGDAVVPVQAALDRLRDLAVEAGAELMEAAPSCEVVVLAGNWSQATDEPFLRHALHPVRQLTLVVEAERPFEPAVRAQWGYLSAAWVDGHLEVTGARWATPHLEVGETEEIVEPRVRDKLHGWAQTHFSAGAILGTRVTIETHSCDGLPLVGPLPGDPRRLLCTGFGRDELTLALAGAEAVTNGLLHGKADLPRLVRPHRLV